MTSLLTQHKVHVKGEANILGIQYPKIFNSWLNIFKNPTKTPDAIFSFRLTYVAFKGNVHP